MKLFIVSDLRFESYSVYLRHCVEAFGGRWLVYFDLELPSDFFSLTIDRSGISQVITELRLDGFDVSYAATESNKIERVDWDLGLVHACASNYVATRYRDPDFRCSRALSKKFFRYSNKLLSGLDRFEAMLSRNEGVDQLFVFNGRVGFSGAIKFFYRNRFSVRFIETSLIGNGFFYCAHQTTHEFLSRSCDFTTRNIRRDENLSDVSKSIMRSRIYEFQSSVNGSQIQFDAVFFLSSEDEIRYSELIPCAGVPSTTVDRIGMLAKVCRSKEMSFAVRAHPNMRSMSARYLTEVERVTTDLGVSYLGPRCALDSLSLIKTGGWCVVDCSSIVIEAHQRRFKVLALMDNIFVDYFASQFKGESKLFEEPGPLRSPEELVNLMASMHVRCNPAASQNETFYRQIVSRIDLMARRINALRSFCSQIIRRRILNL